MQRAPARIALVGAGWWGQGWHLPHLSRNAKATIAAIVDAAEQPSSSLNPYLVPLSELGNIYSAPTYRSVEDLLQASDVTLDGVIVCTPHATHHALATKLLAVDKLNILLEKPFTTDVSEAAALHDAVQKSGNRTFQINHSANWRSQTIVASRIIRKERRIGAVQHVTCFMGSPLASIFDEPRCKDWNTPSGTMIGNGFGWGQMSHIFAWVFQTTGLTPDTVSCSMQYLSKTGADVFDSGVITCDGGATISFSGVACVPGDAHSSQPAGKIIDCKIFGTEGALLFGGDDRIPSSGQLEIRRNDGTTILPDGFHFENCDESGDGPESLQAFLDACQGAHCPDMASSEVGLKTVQAIDAMYRSAKSGKPEKVSHRIYAH